MLDATITEAAVVPRGAWLGGGTALVAWPHPARDLALCPAVAGQAIERPSAFQATPQGDWCFALLRLPHVQPGAALTLDQHGAVAPLPLAAVAEDAVPLAQGLPAPARAALLSLLLGPGIDAFALGRSLPCVALALALARSLRPAGRLSPIARLGDTAVLLPPPRGGGSFVALCDGALEPLRCTGADPLLIDAPCFLARTGAGTLVAIARPPGLPHAAALLARRAGGWRAVDRTLAAAADARSPLAGLAAAARREAEILSPRPAVAIGTTPDGPLAARLEIAIPDHGGGLFLAGRLRDPLGLVAGARLAGADGGIAVPRAALLPVALPAANGRPAEQAGFVLHLPDVPRARPQPVLELLLHSGATLPLTPPAWAGDAAAARDRVLAAVAPAALTPALLAGAIGPAIDRLHRAHLSCDRATELVRIGQGPTRPRTSAIIPLYRTLGFLRTLLAALASDPDWRDVETILVLDSPWQRAEAEHLLRGIHLMHGLTLTLAVMPRNLGYAAANNAGAALARAPHLLLLNSDVVPDAPGWLAPLHAALDQPGVRLAGPKLLFDDASIQHAGLHFAQDGDDVWYNRHYFKGLPRRHVPASVPRLVPGVTGAAMLIDAATFAAVGGFNEDYVIGDYEDSDLCLRLRCAGHEVAYVPQAELWHFERRSISTHAAFAGGCASMLNRDLHHRRWAPVMAALTRRFDA